MRPFLMSTVIFTVAAVASSAAAQATPPPGEVYNELSRAFEDSDPGFQLNAQGATGSSLQIGIVTDVDCQNSQWDIEYIPVNHEVYDLVAGITLANAPTNNNFYHRAHRAMSAMIPYSFASDEHAGVFEAEFFVFNRLRGNDYMSFQCGGINQQTAQDGLDWFVGNGVRLINQPAWQTGTDSKTTGWYVRHFDLVYLLSAGNIHIQENNEFRGAAANANERTVCRYNDNTLCVGGFIDNDYNNEGQPGDLTDDNWWPQSRWDDENLRDVDFPHLVARARHAQTATEVGHMAYRENNDAAVSIATSILGLQLELIQGDWRDCRVTEWSRAHMVLHAGQHPVDGLTTAYHFGHHEHFFNHRTGWGAVTANNRVSNWICPGRGPDGNPCMPTLDPNVCEGPETPDDDIDIPVGLPGHYKQGVLSTVTQGKLLQEVNLGPNLGLRGVLAWTACPKSDVPQEFVHDPFMVDFDLFAIPTNATSESDWIPLSYSYDSTIEAFEFVPEQSGTYQIWRIPTRENWDIYCTYDEPGSTVPPNLIEGEYSSYQSYTFVP